MATYDWAQLKEQAKAEGSSFESLPEGNYTLTVTKGEASKTNDGRKDQIVLDFKVVGGPSNGKSCRYWVTLSPESPKAMAFFFRQMSQFGIDPAEHGSPANIAKALVGRTVDAKVTVKENGYNDVKNVKKATGDVPTAPAAPAASGSVPF